MLSYTIRRVGSVFPLLLGVTVVVFALIQFVPGDPAVVLLGQDATPEAVAEVRETLGLDRPLLVRLGLYLGSVVRGDLGESIFRNEPVLSAVMSRLPATIELAGASLILAIVAGTLVGCVAGLAKGSPFDLLSMTVAQVAISMPVYWLAVLLMLWFAVQLNWLPSVGRGPPLVVGLWDALLGNPRSLGESIKYMILPAAALSVGSAAIISRLVRTAMVEAMSAPFVRMARAKGLALGTLVWRHGLRNALVPVVNVIGLRFGELLAGAVLTESIFGWPGLGQLTVTAISQRDFPVVQGSVLVFAAMFAVVNVLIDVSHGLVDPRVRAEMANTR